MTSVFTRTAQEGSQTFKGKNRRNTHRYSVQTTMQYRTSGREFTSGWKSGQTIDMSVDGILIDGIKGAPVGSMVEVAIDWLGLYHGKSMVRLFVLSSVVRNDSRGTALRILSHEFRDVRSAVITSRRGERNLAVA